MIKSLITLILIAASTQSFASCEDYYNKVQGMEAFDYHVATGTMMDDYTAHEAGFSKEQQERFNCAVAMGIEEKGSLRDDLQAAFGKGSQQGKDFIITVDKN